MLLRILSLLMVLFLLGSCQQQAPVYRPVVTTGFDKTLEAWRAARPGTKVERLDKAQILEAAGNMLIMQRMDGGWPANTHPLRRLTQADRDRFLAQKQTADSSFIDHNIFPQIFYLSHVYLQTGDVRYRNAAKRAIKLVMTSQLYNGGWALAPRSEPLAEGEDAEINTQVTLDALTFLRNVAAGKMPYGYIPFEARRRAADAVRKGDEWLLRVQQAYDSSASIWSPAYGLLSSKPVGLTAAVPPALDVPLSVDIVYYLMKLERPPAAVVRAVTGAADWYKKNTLQQWQINSSSASTADSALPFTAYSPVPLPHDPLWARRYDPWQSAPLADGATGHAWDDAEWLQGMVASDSWYGRWPEALLQDAYLRWREKNYLDSNLSLSGN